VGLTVLVLIRSKLSSIKGAEIGGELAYNSGRVWVMQSLNTLKCSPLKLDTSSR